MKVSIVIDIPDGNHCISHGKECRFYEPDDEFVPSIEFCNLFTKRVYVDGYHAVRCQECVEMIKNGSATLSTERG